MTKNGLDIRRLDGIEICAHEAAPWLACLTGGFGFQHIAQSTGAAAEATGTRRHLLRCGALSIVLQEKVHAGSFVGQYLERHPEGISAVNFLVDDAEAAEARLIESHATPIEALRALTVNKSPWKDIRIATPLGDVEFRFIERADDADPIMPDMETRVAFDPTHNPLGLETVDHLTANVRTLMPVIAFYEHVLGFKRYWDVSFHTEDIQPGTGTGLKSIVMWDEAGGVKMATNEPLRPRFNDSQVQVHVNDNRGPGIQHVSLRVGDILAAAEHLHASGVEFLPVPRAYYQALPNRIAARKIGPVAESLDDIERLGLLLDGDEEGYLLQGFCREQSKQFGRPNAGPVYIELIQRCGCRGFGEGNFRALFEAAERK